MEINEECGDQGSGWMQVKKKHRSNTKFPPHGGSVKLSGKFSSTNLNHMPSLIQKSANNINESLPSVAGRECVVLNDCNASTSIPISAEKEAVDDCIQKSVVLEHEFSDSCHSTAIGSVFSRYKLPVVQEHSSRGNILPNIKWGDLDEGTLVHYGKNSEDIYKELNEVSSEDVKEQIASEKIVMGPIFNLDHGSLKSETDEFDDSSGENTVHEASEDEGMRKIAEAKSDTVLNVSEVPVTGSASSMGPTIPKDREIGSNSNERLDTVNTDVTNTEHTDESKERFRERLWCFLFETLNRSVDELYLLCELECDLDQMREASLVLEEAASDFRELKSRVEKFEKLRRSHEIDGALLIIQSDHRRPHALSWEVRRMTTSPRRAEILSSSLEAFRKIQHERSGERAKNSLDSDHYNHLIKSSNNVNRAARKGVRIGDSSESTVKPSKQTGTSDSSDSYAREKRNVVNGRNNRELRGSSSEAEINKRVKNLTGNSREKNSKSADHVRRHARITEKEREKRNGEWAMDAWKEKRNWEDILASPHRVSSRFSYSPGIGRKSHVLHDKLMSPEKKKKSSIDLKKDAEEKHARATRIRAQLENEKVQKLQRTSEKLNRVNQWQTVRSNKLRESIFDRHQRSESRHEAYLARVVRRAGDESSKVNEVRFITSLNEENKKHILRKKLEDSEVRRAEKLQVMKSKQKEDMAREEAVLERRRLIEAEKLQRLAETQKKKEEAQIRWEEERKASNAAREAKAMEKMRKKEIRAKARKEEAELLAQKLAEKLSESDQRRKFYLEQIRERASTDFRDQSSPFLRRILGKESQAQGSSGDLANSGSGDLTTESRQNLLKRRIKKIRQRLMSLKHEFTEPSAGAECSSIGYRTAVGTARGKIGRWIQDLQKFRQARKEGAANFGLISAEMIKFLDGKEAELQASRQAGLLDFIASALPASHTSKPEACQVTIHLLRLIRIALATTANKCYFLVQNLLPPIIPMLAAALENHIKIAASSTVQGQSNKTSIGNSESISEIVDSFLWIIAAIIGYGSCNENQLQMQYGLVELVIAYQVIHRLRDLVALYDRPQVEGSPFPSSILLSINLLVVITSKFRESSIDWESFPNKLEQMKLLEHENISLTTCIADSGPEHSPSVPECRTLDETSTIEQIKTVDSMDESSRVPTDDKHSVQKNGTNIASNNAEQIKENGLESKHPAKFLLSAMAETGLVCLPSMLTAVLLQANNRLSVDQGSYTLPSNFEEVATGVLKVLNNLALIDVTFIQKMLARPDLKMEFFHLMSFLLSHCTSNWGVPTDKIGFLLMESLSLLGYFALFHPGNQAVLRWGKSPTILHKVCDLPFVFFSDPELMPVLASTLIAGSYGCEQNKAVIQQELSMDMLIPSLKSCKTISIQNSTPVQDYGDSNQMISEAKKLHGDALQRPNRNSIKSTRLIPQKGGALVNNARIMRIRNQRDGKVLKVCEDIYLGSNQSETDTSSLMLHCRFPVSFIDKAEQFFIVEVNTGNGESV